jgi:hypothetical protein
LNDLRRAVAGQILDAKPILVFDHISQNETKRISLHHLVETGFVKRRKIGREEQAVGGILPEYLDPPHLEHLLHWRRLFRKSGFDGFDLFRERPYFLL